MNKIAVLYDAGQAVLSTFDLDEVLQRILGIALQRPHAVHQRGDPAPLAHHRLRGVGIIPQRGVFSLGIKLG